MPAGPRRTCRILAVLGVTAMAVPWVLPLRPMADAILFDGGGIASLICVLLLLSDMGGST